MIIVESTDYMAINANEQNYPEQCPVHQGVFGRLLD